MNISSEGMAITKRFFEAIEMLKAQKQIRGLQAITTRYGINRWNLITVRENLECSVMRPEHIAILIRDFNISAEWIMLGGGGMFKE